MYKKKSGFILVESIIYIFLTAIISFISIKVLINAANIYIETISSSLVIDDIMDCFSNIDRFTKEKDVKKIEARENALLIYKFRENTLYKIEEICIMNNNLIIKYYDTGEEEGYKGRNSLMLDIEEFKVYQKEKLIYISVKKEGKEYEKCI